MILSDPGLGMSVLTQELGEQTGPQYLHARESVECPR